MERSDKNVYSSMTQTALAEQYPAFNNRYNQHYAHQVYIFYDKTSIRQTKFIYSTIKPAFDTPSLYILQ